MPKSGRQLWFFSIVVILMLPIISGVSRWIDFTFMGVTAPETIYEWLEGIFPVGLTVVIPLVVSATYLATRHPFKPTTLFVFNANRMIRSILITLFFGGLAALLISITALDVSKSSWTFWMWGNGLFAIYAIVFAWWCLIIRSSLINSSV